MKDVEKIDLLLNPIVSGNWFFVFVGFGCTVPDSCHLEIDDPKDLTASLEKALKKFEKAPKGYSWSPKPGNYAVFVHQECDFRYIYYRTVEYKEKNQ